MSVILPLPAIRYRVEPGGNLSRRLSPPYDILDAADKQSLLDRDPHNFVEIDLPHVPPKAAGPAEVYAAAAKRMEQWLADGTLGRDTTPAFYVYHQRYAHAGTQYTRKMFFSRLGLEPFGQGSVFPHERTFGGPKEDRLMLMKATRVNLSPIFGLYEDARNEVAARLERALPAKPLCVGELDHTENTLWAVTDAATLQDVTRLMSAKPIYIADGHHRYGTGLLYRDWLTQQQGALPEHHAANFVLCVCCAMEDPGLLILPTHRVLPGVAATDASFVEPNLEIRRLDVSGAEAAIDALRALGPQAIALFSPASGGYFALLPKDRDLLRQFEPDHSPAWRALGLAFLHAYVLDRWVVPKMCGGRPPEIRYIKAAGAAVDEARHSGGVAFLMQPTTMEEMRAVCQAGDLMPQKSTYFYPKLASGLVINPLQ